MSKRAPTKQLPPLSYLRECLDYFTETGNMRWKERPVEHFKDTATRTRKQNCFRWNGIWAGKMAGTVTKEGYRVLSLDGELYKEHRIAFKMGTGREPRSIDHMYGERGDNRLANLACVTHDENLKNQGMYSNNKTGVTGVQYLPKDSKRNPWRATGMANGVYTYLGSHPTLLEAAAVRKSWEIENGFSDRHGKVQKQG